MDKSYGLPYPQVDAIVPDSAESRINASREAIRLRMKTPSAEHDNTSSTESKPDREHEKPEKPIDSWSSLVMSFIAPSAKRTMSDHPYAILGGAAAVGAYLAWSKPWRGVVGSVIVGAVIRNLVSKSFTFGSQNGGRILRHYLNRTPQKKYAPYQKQEHETVGYDA